MKCIAVFLLLTLAGAGICQPPAFTDITDGTHFEAQIPASDAKHYTASHSVSWTITPAGSPFLITPDGGAVSTGATITYTPTAASVDCGGTDDSYTLTITRADNGESLPLPLTACKIPAPATKPVDVVVVMDISGSMADLAICDCITPPAAGSRCAENPNPAGFNKLRYLKEQVLTIFNTLDGHLETDPQNRFGLVTFHSSVVREIGLTSFSDAGLNTQMNTLMDNSGPTTGLQPLFMTSMGGGLKEAIDMLGGASPDPSRSRLILLLTNGMQNESPMVVNSGGSISINSMPAVNLAGTDIKIVPYAIFTPEGSYLTLLEALGNAGGVTDLGLTASPYICSLSEPLEEGLIDGIEAIGSPKLLEFRTNQLNGNSGLETFQVNENMDMLTLNVSSVGTHNYTALKLEKISGGVATDISGFGAIIPPLSTPSQHRVIHVKFPLPIPGGGNTAGEYRFSFTANQPDLSYNASLIVDDRGLKQNFFASPITAAGESMLLGASLTQAGNPVANATVTAVIYRPKTALGNALAKTPVPAQYIDVKGPWGPFFPGKGFYDSPKSAAFAFRPGKGDGYIKRITISHPTLPSFQKEGARMKNGEKKYLVLMNETGFKENYDQEIIATIPLSHVGNGIYRAKYDGTARTGLYHVRFTAEGNHPVIGSYKRIDEKTPQVRFGTPDPKGSCLFVLYDAPLIISLKPKDLQGNLLGPNEAAAIRITMSSGSAGIPTDYLDGRYLVPLTLSGADPDPRMEISVYGRILYRGPLSGIRQKRAFVSVGGGLTIPQGQFSNDFGNGYFFEGKIGYRIYQQLSIQAKGGYYLFKDLESGKTNYGIGSVGAGLSYRQWVNVLTGVYLQAEANAGFYKPEGIDAAFGYNAGAEIIKPLGHFVNLGVGANYHSVQSKPSALNFMTAGLALQIRF